MPSNAPSVDTPTFGVRANQGLLFIAKHWLAIVIVLAGLYALLPFTAPIFMRLGLTSIGNLVYDINSPLCHQYSFRTWFLFGEQPAYPRQAANVAGLQPFETFSASIIAADPMYAMQNPPPNLSEWNPDTLMIARGFRGNAQMGYKVAQCERNVAIYTALFLGCLIFSIPRVRRNLRTAPFLLYILVGILPIGLDGFAQLLSEPPFSLIPMYESSPLFRTLTGALFGLMNAWLALPYLAESMRQTQREIEAKLARRQERLAGRFAA